jgi:hypothetical protein
MSEQKSSTFGNLFGKALDLSALPAPTPTAPTSPPARSGVSSGLVSGTGGGFKLPVGH